MRLTELKIVQCKLKANEVQCKVVRGEFSVIRRAFRPVVQFAEQVLHEAVRTLHFLIHTGLLSDHAYRGSLVLSPGWQKHVLLRLIVSLLGIGNQKLCHMVDNHANPLAIHDFEATYALEMPITLLEGLKDLICIAG